MLNTQIIRRAVNHELYHSAIHSNASSFQADILSKRKLPKSIDISGFLNPNLLSIDTSTLKDINKATTRIIKAIMMGEIIAIVCDFDIDGVSAGTILYESLVNVFGCNPNRVKFYATHRIDYGFGLTQNLFKRIQETEPTPTLILTADLGSRSEIQISAHKKWAKSKGIISDIIVIDHHEIDELNLPKTAYAFINPKQPDCEFVCKDICGAVVALLLMANTRSRLIEKGIRTSESLQTMGVTLPLAAIATLSDSTSLAQPINRAFVHSGVRRMNSDADICWKTFRKHILNKNEPITARTIGHTLAPIFNLASRFNNNALLGIKMLLADSENEALRYIYALEQIPEASKELQDGLFLSADVTALQQVNIENRFGLCLYQPNCNIGIQSIIATRVSQRHCRPVIIFAPNRNKKTKVKFDIIENEDLDVDIFKKVADLNEVMINENQFIEIKKTPQRNMLKFTLNSVSNNTITSSRELSIYQATKLTKKNLFKGLGKKEHRFKTKFDDLLLDLNNLSKPTLYLEGVDEVIGHVQSVNGISIKNIFKRIELEHPSLITTYDGDEFSGVIKINIDNIEPLSKLFSLYVKDECDKNNQQLQACYFSDGELPENRILDLSLIDELNLLEPFGVEFERPAFEFSVQVTKIERIKNTDDYKLRVLWNRNGVSYTATWGKLGEQTQLLSEIKSGARSNVRLLCELGDNYSRHRAVTLDIVAFIE